MAVFCSPKKVALSAIPLTGSGAAIIAFVHDADEQARFAEADIPAEIEQMMGHMEGGDAHEDADEAHD